MMRLPIIVFLAVCTIHAQAPDPDLQYLRTIGKKDRVDQAVRKGFKYLMSKQDPKTGAFNHYELPNAMTGLVCLALMSDGVVPGKGRYGVQLQAAIRYLIEACNKGKGYFGYEANGKMYSHGVCTIALCEAFGMMPTAKENRQLGKAVERAIKVIIDAQVTSRGRYLGGWHYHPKATKADLSISVWQILAIKAALNCNIDVPDRVIDNAAAFVRRFYNAKAESFTYDGKTVTPTMRAAGPVALMALQEGKAGDDAIKVRKSAGPLLNLNLDLGKEYYSQCFFLAFCANSLGGKYEKRILPKLQEALLKVQSKDGGFAKQPKAFGRVYSTAFAILALNVRRELLPVTQD